MTASAMAELSCNIRTNRNKELVLNSDSEEKCTSDVFDKNMVMILVQQIKCGMTEKDKTGIQFFSLMFPILH
jgi:hypothetical protein